MEFASDKHREVYQRVKVYLAELFDDKLYHEEETGHFYVRYGSTVLEISVEPYGVDDADDAIMIAMSYCVQGVEVDEELLRGLLELNHTLPFGSFSLVGDDIFFSHSLLGQTLERSNVLATIAAVANVSDEYDDRIVERFGGQRALDRIRDTGGLKRRRESIGR
ncbi:MAG TPA: YbjN domain-containing protein [Thermoanaerobaculia bacterium]|jgi:hypothetical protein